MKRFFSLALSLLMVLPLGACAPAEQPGSASPPEVSAPGDTSVQLPVNVPFALPIYTEQSLHPVLTANRANLTLAPLLYEPLFQVNGAFEAEQVLCSGWSVSEDKLTWTFSLQAGVTFSDGTPLTGEAVADALTLACGKDSRYSSRLACVTHITGTEDSVTVVLNQPRGNLPLLLDIPIALGGEDVPPGTGPYVLRDEGGVPVLTARSDWWQSSHLPAEELLLQPVETGDELIFSFDSGSIALVDVDLMGTNALGFSGSYETWDYATTDMIYLGFNTRKDTLFEDPALRQAVAKAVDRDTVTRTVFSGHAIPSSLPVHPDSSVWDRNLASVWDYDTQPLVAAVSGLKESRRTLTFLVNSENSAKVSTAELITYQLESVGLTVSLQILPFEDYAAALKAGKYDLYLGEVVLTADFDLSPLLSPTGALNYSGWADEAIPDLLTRAASASPGETADTHALLTHLEGQVPFTPICFKNGSVLTRWGRLSGLDPLRSNVFYRLENWIME